MKIILLSIFIFLISRVEGHGRIMVPPARNAMWRFGYSNPINYNDNEVWCGGMTIQYEQNGGKCGVCGDDYADKRPREHEAGGKYGNGIIGAEYVMGQVIDIEIDLTTNHFGYFELKLCPIKNKKTLTTQECFDKYPLYLVEKPSSSKYVLPLDTPRSDNVTYQVRLPKGVTCKQCVIQWTYFTGNTWGDCGNGTSGVGCGNQEMFRNCADVRISSNTFQRPPNALETRANPVYFHGKNGKKPLVVRSQVCVPRSSYSPNLVDWCKVNCLSYPKACNKEICMCRKECFAIGEKKGDPREDFFCQMNCLSNTLECPSDRCECTEEDDDDFS